MTINEGSIIWVRLQERNLLRIPRPGVDDLAFERIWEEINQGVRKLIQTIPNRRTKKSEHSNQL